MNGVDLTTVAVLVLSLTMLLAERRFLRLERRIDALVQQLSPRACRVCGCTEDRACMLGCWWVEPDLCSRCVDEDAE